MITTEKNIVVAGLYAKRVVDTAIEMSISVTQLSELTGIEESTLLVLPDLLPGASYLALMQAAMELSQDGDFGLHVGERISPASYPVLGYTLMSCRNLSHAISQVTRYESIIHNLGHFGLELTNDAMTLTWSSALPESSASRQVTESVMSGVRVFAERLVAREIPVRQVTFTHVAPDNLEEHHRLLGERIVFGAATNSVTCDRAILDWEVPNADASLFPLLKEHAERLLAQRADDSPSIVEDVRKALSSMLSTGDVKLKQVAERLEMHPRTLQRRLNDVDSSFQDILEGVRKDMAKRYLADHSMSLAEVAFLLGYHDQSSFNRAFKEWTGESPSSFRDGGRSA